MPDTALFVVPMLDSPNVVYSTGYQTHETGCRVCGGTPAATNDPTPRIYCSRKHQRQANKWRRRDPGWTPRFTGEAVCPYCGETFGPPERRRVVCLSPACRRTYRSRGFHVFARRVKQPHPLAWLGPKIARASDDELLPRYAVGLALKGKLVVYVRADGTVGEVGRPRTVRK
jgi:hypothetical protein